MKSTAILRGNVGGDITVRKHNDDLVANFNIYVPVLKKKDDAFEDANGYWVDVSYWTKRAEHIKKIVQKGMNVLVIGELGENRYKTKDGEEKTSIILNASSVSLVLANEKVRGIEYRELESNKDK